MTPKELGDEPANPCTSDHTNTRFSSRGLTKRELFAAMAMQALLPTIRVPEDATALYDISIRCADKLLAALAK